MARALLWQPGGLLLGLEPLKTSRVQRKEMERRLDGPCHPKEAEPHTKPSGDTGFDVRLSSLPLGRSASVLREQGSYLRGSKNAAGA